MTVVITRLDLDAGGLRAAAARAKDAAAARRMLALAMVLEGQSRSEAARSAGMDRQTLRFGGSGKRPVDVFPDERVHRYNAAGLEGLTNRCNRGGPSRKLTPAQEAAFAEWVREGPKLEEHKVVRWRCCDLRDEIARRFGVKMHERTMGKILARLSFSRVSVRPRHPDQDVAAQEAHKKTSPIWSQRPSPSMPGASRSSSGGRSKPG